MDFELRADPAFSLTMNWDLRFVINASFVECSHATKRDIGPPSAVTEHERKTLISFAAGMSGPVHGSVSWLFLNGLTERFK